MKEQACIYRPEVSFPQQAIFFFSFSTEYQISFLLLFYLAIYLSKGSLGLIKKKKPEQWGKQNQSKNEVVQNKETLTLKNFLSPLSCRRHQHYIFLHEPHVIFSLPKQLCTFIISSGHPNDFQVSDIILTEVHSCPVYFPFTPSPSRGSSILQISQTKNCVFLVYSTYSELRTFESLI